MNPSGASPSGMIAMRTVTVNVDPPNLVANLGVYADVAVPGAKPGQAVIVNPAADFSTVGYTIGDARVSALDTVRVQFINATAGALNPAALNLNFQLLGF